MRQGELNDAAISLSEVLSAGNVRHGLFGGCAVTALGGPSEAKDIDCLVAASKQQIVSTLDRKGGFTVIPPRADDFVAFLWTDGSNNEQVLVELSLASEAAMQSAVPKVIRVRGEQRGEGSTSILGEPYLFKGKLRSAAVRAKPDDAADLIFLESRFPDALRTGTNQYRPHYAGLALRRYPHLLPVFQRVGIDVEAANNAARHFSLESPPPLQNGDIQRALLE
ncbi:MAG: hypothetical protein M1813_009749 [Trichoglossum hirsutum]|nr:MAG: hypothetical protein M1813_009749 [Trichoglossum hirsutum]